MAREIKSLSLVLTGLITMLVLLLALPAQTAFAENGDPYDWYTSNTESSTFTLTSSSDIVEFSQIVNGRADLDGNDIADGNPVSFAGKTVTLFGSILLSPVDAVVLEPIGTAATPFSGTFDGGGFTISNYSLTNYYRDAGFFGFADSSSTIKELNLTGRITLTSTNTTGSINSVGLLVGRSEGVIEGCNVTALIDITGECEPTDSNPTVMQNIGALVGSAKYDVRDCTSAGSLKIYSRVSPIVGEWGEGSAIVASAIGGMVGRFGGTTEGVATEHGTIENCTNSLNIEIDIMGRGGTDNWGTNLYSAFQYVGGIAGYSSGNIVSCANSGEIATSMRSDTSLNGYRAWARVTQGNGATGSGGIVGGLRVRAASFGSGSSEDAGNAEDPLVIENCLNTGVVTGLNGVGGIVGIAGSYTIITECQNGNGKIIQNYYDGRFDEGSVISTRWNKPGTGGIAGHSYGTISFSFNRAAVVNANIGYYQGGIAGMLLQSAGDKPEPEIYACYNTGRIGSFTAGYDYRFGGIVGDNNGYVHDSVTMQGTVIGANDSLIGGNIHRKWSNLRVLTSDELASSVGPSTLNSNCSLNENDEWPLYWHVAGPEVNDGYPVLSTHTPQTGDLGDISTMPLTVLNDSVAPYNGSRDPIPAISVAHEGTTLLQNGDFYVVPQENTAGEFGPGPYQAILKGIGRYWGANYSITYSIGSGTLKDAQVSHSPTKFNYEVQFPDNVWVHDEVGNEIAPENYSYLIYDSTTPNLTTINASRFVVYDSMGYIRYADETDNYTLEDVGWNYAIDEKLADYKGRAFRVYDRDRNIISDSEGWVYDPLAGDKKSGTYVAGLTEPVGFSCFEYSTPETLNIHYDSQSDAGYILEVLGREDSHYAGSSAVGSYIIEMIDLFEDCVIEEITYKGETWQVDMTSSSEPVPYQMIDDERVEGITIPFEGFTVMPVLNLVYTNKDGDRYEPTRGYAFESGEVSSGDQWIYEGRGAPNPNFYIHNQRSDFYQLYGKVAPGYGGYLGAEDVQPNRNVTGDEYAAAVTALYKDCLYMPAERELSASLQAPEHRSVGYGYTNYVTIPFDIEPMSFDSEAITVEADVCVANGEPRRPVKVVLTSGINTNVLKEGLDYTIEYSNNIEVGTAHAIITPLGPNLVGEPREIDFEISEAQTFKLVQPNDFVFKMEEGNPRPVFTDEEGNLLSLIAGVDYEVAYRSRDYWQNRIMTVTGKGLYEGCDASANYQMIELDISKLDEEPENWRIEGSPILTYKPRSNWAIDQGFVTRNNGNFRIYWKDKLIFGAGELAPRGGSDDLRFWWGEDVAEVTVATRNAGDTIDRVTISSLDNPAVPGINFHDGQVTFVLNEPVTIQPRQIGSLTSALTFTYTGQPAKPSDSLFSGLQEGTDYEVEIINGTNVGKGTLIVTGINNYIGRTSARITIEPYNITPAGAVNVAEITPVPYEGAPAKPALTITDANSPANILEEGKDYTVTYGTNTSPGTGYAFVVGIGNYKGTITVPFEISSSLDAVSIEGLSAPAIVGAGVSLDPALTLTIPSGEDTYTLVEGVDYEISCIPANPSVGEPVQVTISGIGGFYGSKTETLNIALEATVNESSRVTYGSSTLSSELVTVTDSIFTLGSSSYSITPLDRYIEVGENGRALITVTEGSHIGARGYINYPVTDKAIANPTVSTEGILVSSDVILVYNGATRDLPSLSIFDSATERELTQGVDCQISYLNNRNAGTAQLVLTIPATAKNYVAAEVSLPFTIAPFNIEPQGALTIADIPSQAFADAPLTPSVSIKDKNNLNLQEGRDYTLSYATNNAPGTGAVIITGTGNYTGEVWKTFTITDGRSDISASTFSVLDPTQIGPNGKPLTFVNGKQFTHTGAEIKPVIGIGTPQGEILVEGVDFTVSYTNNVNVGEATITVTGTGAYKGEVKRTFIIKASGDTTPDNRTDIAAGAFKLIDPVQTGSDGKPLAFPEGKAFVYTGAEIKPAIGLSDSQGSMLKENVDYTVSYSYNTAAGVATITVTGIGAYKGEVTTTYTIKRVSAFSGSDRYQTAALAATAAFPNGAPGVVIATGGNFPDALAAAGLAGIKGYPLLMVSVDAVPEATQNALRALAPKEVLIMGGTSSVGAGALNTIASLTGTSEASGTIKRYGGADRIETSLLIYEAGRGQWSDTAIVTTSANFPDALSISPYAYWSNSPIFLVGSTLDDRVANALSSGGFKRVLILGGANSVSDSIEQTIAQITGASSASGTLIRFAGGNRYETSQLIGQWALGQGMTLNGSGIATGGNFPDALAAGPVLGSTGSVVMLTADSDRTSLGLLNGAPAHVHGLSFFGGANSISDAIRQDAVGRLGWPEGVLQ